LNKMLFLYFYIITIIAFKFSLTILIFLNIVLYILYNIRLFKPSNIYKLYQSGKIFSKMFPQTNIIINFNLFFCIKVYYFFFKNLCKYLLLKFFKILPLLNIFKLKWKPLFKKSSYFGIYRSTRNQFLNK